MRLARRVFLAALAASGAARGDVVSDRPESVTVTFYHDEGLATSQILHPDANPWVRNEGFAFITETRTIDLPAGASEVKFEGVASTMVPQTAEIEGLPEGVRESNFDYDLLSHGSLLEKSIGETVRLVRTDRKTGRATEETAVVRSGPNGAVFEVNGKFEALQCSGLPERIVFDHIPGGLSDKPTLSVRTHALSAGRYTIKLSYIATGLNWSADYVARVVPGSDRLALSGWLTLANFSATSFSQAPVDVVAGHLQTTGDDKPVEAAPRVFAPSCWPTEIDWATHRPPPPPPPPPPPETMQSVPMAIVAQHKSESVVVTGSRIEAQALGDYKIYRLPEATTVSARETKQIQFLDQDAVPFARIYRYTIEGYQRAEDLPLRASVVLKFENREDKGLGKPLPAGGVSVFEPGPEGAFIFTGQNTIRDIAVGLPVEVEIGRAMDVRVVPRLVEATRSGNANARKSTDVWEVALANDKPVPIAFEFRQSLYGSEAKIVTESRPHQTVSGRAVWSVPLKAGERTILRFTIVHPAPD